LQRAKTVTKVKRHLRIAIEATSTKAQSMPAPAVGRALAPASKFYIERNWHGQPVTRNAEAERKRHAERAAFVARKQLAAGKEGGKASDALKRRARSKLEAFETQQWLATRATLRPKAVSISERRDGVLKTMFSSLCQLTNGGSIIALDQIRAAINNLPVHDNDSRATGHALIDKIVECFTKLDTDGNGTIDYGEFVAVMTSQSSDKIFLSLQEQLSMKGMTEPIYHFRYFDVTFSLFLL
jgi:EF hand